MSGSRTVHPNSYQRELMFCHQCQNEWYREHSGTQCPRCESDFTEVIDPDFDPRAEAVPGNPLSSHNPWAEDPGEDDIDDLERSFDQSYNNRDSSEIRYQGVPSPFGFLRDAPGRGPAGNFASMFQSMLGTGLGHYNLPGPGATFQRDSEAGDGLAPGSSSRANGPRVNVWTTSGPGFTFTAQTSTRSFSNGGMRMGGQEMAPQDVSLLLEGIFRNMGIPDGSSNASRAGGPLPFAALFNSILNPGNAAHGDTVFTQEAFDRVMSQLMEEHASGNAPGPASEAAINALPKRKVTESMLDEMTKKAECSICMDDVTVGEEVTTLPCGHWFHFPCVEAWLKEHDTCPVCRSGIMPKDGHRDTLRSPSQMPLHDDDPFLLARHQSGTRDHPYVVPESPTLDRRRSNSRRQSSSDAAASSSRRSSQRDEDRPGISGRVRKFFGGNGGSSSKRT